MGSATPGTVRLLFAAGLLLRLAVAATLPGGMGRLERLPDQVEYVDLARQMLYDGRLVLRDPRFDQDVHAYRLPGYPAFVAVSGASPTAVRLAQAIVDSLTILAAAGVCNNVLRRAQVSDPKRVKAMTITAFFVAVNPMAIYFSGLVLSETLYTGLIAWSIWLLLPAATMTKRRWGGAIILLLASIYVRPSGLLFPVVLAGLAGILNHPIPTGLAGMMNRPGQGGPSTATNQGPAMAYRLRKGLFLGVGMGCLTFIALTPWAYRNYRIFGQWIWTTTNVGMTAYDGWNNHADGSSDQSFIKAMPELQQMGEVERSGYLKAKANAFIAEHPARAVELAGLKIARTWSPIPLSEQFGGNPMYVAAGLLFGVPFFLVTIHGLWAGDIARSMKLFLLSPAIYFTIVHAASVGSLRYRLPAEPALAVLAGLGAARGARRDRAAGELVGSS